MKQLFTLAAVLIITQLSYAQIPDYLPQEGLVAWYPFNGNANDESGNSLNLGVSGAELINDRFNSSEEAYNFSNGYLARNNSSLFNTNEMTLSLWVKAENLQQSTVDNVFAGSYTNPSGFWTAIQSDGSILHRLHDAQFSGDTKDFISISSISWNEWTHIVISVGEFTSMYINGVLDFQVFTDFEWVNNNRFILGTPSWFLGQSNFGGSLDDVAYYSRALTQTEVEAIYNGELPPVCDPCIDNYMAGDINCDGVVGTEDLLLLLVGFGSTIEP